MNRLCTLFAMLFLIGNASAQVLVNETFETGNTVDQPPVGWISDDGGWKAGIAIPDDNTARGRKPHTGDWYMYATYNTDVWTYKEIDVTDGSYLTMKTTSRRQPCSKQQAQVRFMLVSTAWPTMVPGISRSTM